MVLLGGLEIVAAGYLIHKHQQNKKDKQRLEEEEAALEESQYRIFPPDRPSSSQHRRRRSHSRESSGRHSYERRDRDDRRRHDRPHSSDGKYRHESPPRRDSARPQKPQQQQMPAPMPVYQAPVPIITHSAPPQQQSAMRPPPPPSYASVPTATAGPPQDMKYGWTDATDPAARPSQHDPNDPPTGWPAHWAQSQTPPTTQSQSQSGREESSSRRERRERSERGERRGRTPEPNSPRVRFAVPGGDRDSSRSPPPSYRA